MSTATVTPFAHSNHSQDGPDSTKKTKTARENKVTSRPAQDEDAEAEQSEMRISIPARCAEQLKQFGRLEGQRAAATLVAKARAAFVQTLSKTLDDDEEIAALVEEAMSKKATK